MAPRRRRSKVGLRRMDAALDAMRPMGFSTGVVLESVKNLLKVYGNEGWAFIEEASYKLLIETILEEPEGDQLEHETEPMPLEGGSQGSHEQPASGHEPCDKEATNDEPEEPSCASEIPGSGIHCQDVKLERVKIEVQDSGFEDVKDQKKKRVELGFAAAAYNPQLEGRILTDRRCRVCRPCYGWISDDDEGEERVVATPCSSMTTDLAA